MPDRRRPRPAVPADRPSKTCARCGRPFAWRKKWERDWESVRYCSDRCRMGKSVEARSASDPPADPRRERGRDR